MKLFPLLNYRLILKKIAGKDAERLTVQDSRLLSLYLFDQQFAHLFALNQPIVNRIHKMNAAIKTGDGQC